MRRLLEAVAHERPLVVVVEDAHWADPTLLDLLEYLVAFSSGSRSCCSASHGRSCSSAGPRGRRRSPARRCWCSSRSASRRARAGRDARRGGARPARADSIVATAEGNPLFLEQLLAVKAEGELTTLPPSIEAVLAARIDRLEPGEREVLVHASVEGRSFHAGAVAELMAECEPDAVGTALMGLVHKQLVRPDRPEFAGEDAFRFPHALIRDAAYGGMPKRLRAELHERLAGWLGRSRASRDEILGYHLEQACRYRAELGHADEHDRALAGEAAERLAAAAQAALARGDAAAAARLLERAVALLPPEDPARPALLSSSGRRSWRPAGSRTPTASSPRRSRAPSTTATRGSRHAPASSSSSDGSVRGPARVSSRRGRSRTWR